MIYFIFYCIQDGGDNQKGSTWTFSPSIVNQLDGVFEPGADETVLHYFLNTIENIAGQAPAFATVFASEEVCPLPPPCCLLCLLCCHQFASLTTVLFTQLSLNTAHKQTRRGDAADKR